MTLPSLLIYSILLVLMTMSLQAKPRSQCFLRATSLRKKVAKSMRGSSQGLIRHPSQSKPTQFPEGFETMRSPLTAKICVSRTSLRVAELESAPHKTTPAMSIHIQTINLDTIAVAITRILRPRLPKMLENSASRGLIFQMAANQPEEPSRWELWKLQQLSEWSTQRQNWQWANRLRWKLRWWLRWKLAVVRTECR